jgi:hypothetical protein
MKRNVQIAVCCICLSVCVTVIAQVSIGSDIVPAKGALLELKQFAPDSYNATAGADGGGLVLPRVVLSDKKTLEPFIDPSSAEWQAGTVRDKTKSDHIGLIVYNVEDNPVFKQGLYIWQGVWTALKLASTNIPLPAFNLPWGTGTLTFNLFEDVYKKNFAPVAATHYISSTGAHVHFPPYDDNPADFHYAVTYYDTAVYNITSISDSGVMTYSCIGAAPPDDNLRINVVMVKK